MFPSNIKKLVGIFISWIVVPQYKSGMSLLAMLLCSNSWLDYCRSFQRRMAVEGLTTSVTEGRWPDATTAVVDGSQRSPQNGSDLSMVWRFTHANWLVCRHEAIPISWDWICNHLYLVTVSLVSFNDAPCLGDIAPCSWQPQRSPCRALLEHSLDCHFLALSLFIPYSETILEHLQIETQNPAMATMVVMKIQGSVFWIDLPKKITPSSKEH